MQDDFFHNIHTPLLSCSFLCLFRGSLVVSLCSRMEAPQDQDLAALRRNVRRLQQKKRRQEAAAVSETVVTPQEIRLACLVYTLGGNSRALAASFLQRWGRRSQARDCQGAAMEELVEDVVWECRAERLLPAAAALKDQVLAARYVVEYKLFHWVFRQNTRQGVAPGRSHLVDQAVSFIPEALSADVKDRLRVLLAGQPRSQRKWLAKFRKHWGGRLGILKVTDEVPVAEMKLKVRGRKWEV